MLYLVGIGLNPKQITLEAIETLKASQSIYLENYTSRFAQGSVAELEKTIGKTIEPLSRKQVEEGFQSILEKSKKETVSLLVFGNPLIATTHIQIALDCQEQKIPFKVIPGISVLDLLGKTGLDPYKFGRISTIVFPQENYAPESFFDFIETNQKNGLHSLCLLDIQAEQNKLMSIPEAVTILQAIAKKRKATWFEKNLLIGLAGLGNANEQIVAGTADELKTKPFDQYPQSLIVCGKRNEKEQEALEKIWTVKK